MQSKASGLMFAAALALSTLSSSAYADTTVVAFDSLAGTSVSMQAPQLAFWGPGTVDGVHYDFVQVQVVTSPSNPILTACSAKADTAATTGKRFNIYGVLDWQNSGIVQITSIDGCITNLP